EPMWTGLGGDMFAQVWRDGALEGLDAAGPAPLRAQPLAPVDLTGPRSVTVPGAARGWEALADRHARLGLEAALAPAIDAASRGVAIAPRAAAAWQRFGGPAQLGSPPGDAGPTWVRSSPARPRTSAPSTATAWPSPSSSASSTPSARVWSPRERASCSRTAAPALRSPGA